MTKEEIIKDNELIAEFMGATHYEPSTGVFGTCDYFKFPMHMFDEERIKSSDLEYHFSWNWLMPVIEKICTLKIGDGITYVDYGYPRTFGMTNQETGQLMVRLNGFQLFQSDKLIDAAYEAIVDFIKWYNNNKL